MSEDKKTNIDGGVFYSDGGAKPNPGPSGYGIHGYTYTKEIGKKGTGLSSHTLTNAGYVFKNTESDQETPSFETFQVTPLAYYDGLRAFGEPRTNNYAELVGAIRVLELALELNLPELTLISDSEYVIKGATKYINAWRNNGWKRPDGEFIKNIDEWKQFDDLLQVLKQSCVVHLEWLRGHNGSLGNERADQLATIARTMAYSGKETTEMTPSPPEGYWKSEAVRHPLITHRRMYFISDADKITPGVYFIGDHGINDDDVFGKPIGDISFACVFLNKPEPVLETIRTTHLNQDTQMQQLAYARLDYAYSGDPWYLINKYGQHALASVGSRGLGLYGPDKQPITTVFRPSGMEMRGYMIMGALCDILDAYKKNKDGYVITDITDQIYTTEVVRGKKGSPDKTKYQLRPEFIVGLASITVPVKCPFMGTITDNQLILTLGLDLPDRNNLKKIEALMPKVSVISWAVSEYSYKFATVIDAGEDIGIWCGYYSNLRIMSRNGGV